MTVSRGKTHALVASFTAPSFAAGRIVNVAAWDKGPDVFNMLGKEKT